MRSLHQHITQLRTFIDLYPDQASKSEKLISDLASKAEHLTDFYMTQLLNSYEVRSTKLAEKSETATSGSGTSMEELARLITMMTVKYPTDADHQPPQTTTKDYEYVDTDKMIGFDEDLEALKDRLLGGESKLQVIPVCGEGGIGKTTLAKNLYEHPQIVERFQVRAWLRVSRSYDLEQLRETLLSFARAVNKGESTGKDKTTDVYQCLKGKRFLVMLDDVWSLKFWYDFKWLLPDDSKGSRVVLTTRFSDVAEYDDFAKFHEVKLMDLDRSWELLAHKLSDVIKKYPEELEKVGKSLAEICLGLPLSIVLMAGILRGLPPRPDSWRSMAKSVKSKTNQLQKIMDVIYNRLPFYLRSCFLYMGMFSDYADVAVSNLTKLWVAEGFLKPPGQTGQSDEQAAEQYLEDLAKINLVFVGTRKSNGKIKRCGIHDIVRGMCQERSSTEGFLQHVKDRYPERINREEDAEEEVDEEEEEDIDDSNWLEKHASYSASIQAVQSFKHGKGTLDLNRCFRSLKILELMKVEFRSFPDEVLELFLLKYLGLGHVAEVPPTISRLWNLEALVIHPRVVSTSYLPYIVCFPPSIWKMTKLRHLVSFSYGTLPDPGEGSCVLENLQTLNAIVNMQCKEWISKIIPNIKKLGVYFVGTKKDTYSLENLEHMQSLEKLKLSVLVPFSAPQKLNVAFPKTLRKLTLRGCRLPWEDMGVISLLPHLEVLKLKRLSFQGNVWETQEEFPALKYLLLEELGLESWITDKEHFPMLKSLTIRDCEDFHELDEEVGSFESIERIEVVGTNKTLADLAKTAGENAKHMGHNVTVYVGGYAS